jgi:hypothetical protein
MDEYEDIENWTWRDHTKVAIVLAVLLVGLVIPFLGTCGYLPRS